MAERYYNAVQILLLRYTHLIRSQIYELCMSILPVKVELVNIRIILESIFSLIVKSPPRIREVISYCCCETMINKHSLYLGWLFSTEL